MYFFIFVSYNHKIVEPKENISTGNIKPGRKENHGGEKGLV